MKTLIREKIENDKSLFNELAERNISKTIVYKFLGHTSRELPLETLKDLIEVIFKDKSEEVFRYFITELNSSLNIEKAMRYCREKGYEKELEILKRNHKLTNWL